MNYIDYIIIAGYLIGLLLLGFLLKNQTGKTDYFLGGRTIGWKPLSLSIMATQLSAISFISAPAFVGLREDGGLIWLSYELALPLAMLFLLWTLLPVLHQSGVVSVYDYLEKRFDRSSRLLLSLVFQISRSFATGIMIYAVSIILQGAIGLAMWQSVVAIGVITVIYSLTGGMKAVVYGDAIQMIIIILGTATCLGFGLYYLGGFEAFLSRVDVQRIEVLNFTSTGFDGGGFGFLPMLFGGMVLYASYYGCDQSEAQRALSAKDTGDLKKMIIAASIMRFPIALLYCTSGLVIGTLVLSTPDLLNAIPAEHPDWMMPIFIVNYLPNGIIGLLLVAIFAAAMSSLSSAINSLSAVSVEDYCRYTNSTLSDGQYLRYARYAGVFWGLVTLALSFFAGDIAPTVIEAINKIGSIFFGPVLACFLLGVADKRIAAIHINTGLISGVLINVGLWLLAENIFWFWWNAIGFSATIIVAYLMMLLVRKPRYKAPASQLHTSSILNSFDVALLVGWFAVILATCIAIPIFFG